MELKLIKSLNDIPTLTELAILTLYGKQVSSTYMKYIQGKKMINHLTPGPFHQKLLNFLDCLIDTPNLISDNPNDKLHFLKGKSYSDSLAVKAVLALAPQLPHLSGLFKAFLVGTRPVWACFSSELRVLLVYQIRTRLFPWARSFKNFQQFSESIDTVY